MIENSHQSNNIFTDSQSTIKNLENTTNTADIAKTITKKKKPIQTRYNIEINITFIWITGQNNIKRNEKLNQKAKRATELTKYTPGLQISTRTDIKNHIQDTIKIRWQTNWKK